MLAVPSECFLPDLFPVAAKKKEEEEERARKEKAEKGGGFFAVFIESLGCDQDWELHKRLLADSVMMTSAGSEGCDRNGLCVTWFNTDGRLSKHKTHTSECEGSIWKYLLPAWNIDFYPRSFLIMPGSRAVEEAVGGGGRGEAEADSCAC